MKIGFTGTRKGMTSAQLSGLKRLLSGYAGPLTEFHHGDCVGADEEAHGIVREIEAHKIKIIIHPPVELRWRAKCRGDEALPPKNYMRRNRDIVNVCDILVAVSDSDKELISSGTWSTVRYARKTGKPRIIIYPSGVVMEEK